MASSFYSNNENFDRIFFTENQLIDRYIGNRGFGAGNDNQGNLGTGSTATSRLSFVDYAGLGSTWKQVSAASGLTAAASTSFSAGIKTDGTLWTWGYNLNGQLGSGATASRSSPLTVAGGGTDWAEVSASSGSFCAAIKLDGSLWTWGLNSTGNLGDNSTTARSSPVSVSIAAANNWLHVATGGATSRFTIATRTDGTLWTWGINSVGQLGDGSTNNRSSPGTVAGGGNDWVKVAAGNQTSAAIKNNGTLWTWGGNSTTFGIPVGSGILGDGSTTARSSPQTVAGGGTNWKQVSIASDGGFAAGIKTDGTLWTWGRNNQGQLGIGNTTTDRSSPGTVAGGGTTWKQVSCGYTHAAAIKTDGSMWTWGKNSEGALATGDIVNRSSPSTIVGGVAEWTQVSCSGWASGTGNTSTTLAIALFIGGG